jgi:hypothetical protein
MNKIRFYVVEHKSGGYSVQTDPNGKATWLDLPCDLEHYEAEIARDAANSALEIVGMLKGI